MKITNKTKLPAIIEEWAKCDDYNRGTADFTTTELIKPERVLTLERKHWDDIEVDVCDLTWRMSGQAKHVIFERIARQNPERYIAEKRYSMSVAGVIISGQLDLFDTQTGILYDYKESKVWKQIMGADDKEWTAQANINAFLCRNVGNHKVKGLSNIVLFKDWSMRMAARDHKYPQHEMKEWPLNMWDPQVTLQFIQARVAKHRKAQNGTGLPLCTPEERWSRPAKWAVMKQGRKTAVKLFDSHVEADAFVREATDYKVLTVEERASEDTRCRFYCDVAKFCDHGQQVLKGAA